VDILTQIALFTKQVAIFVTFFKGPVLTSGINLTMICTLKNVGVVHLEEDFVFPIRSPGHLVSQIALRAIFLKVL